jgi:general secretion pathway protein N
LRLQGSGEWTGQGWRFKGEASADPQSEAALQNLLNMLGRREGGKALLTLG